MPMTPPPNLKREASTDTEAPPSKKRQSSTITFDNSSNLMRVRASGQKVRLEAMYTEDDELVQGLQQQDVKTTARSRTADRSEYVKEEDAGSPFEDTDADAVSDEEMQDGELRRECAEEDDDDIDLFAKTGFREEESADGDDAGDTDGEVVEISRPSNVKHKQRATDYDDHHATEHTAGCKTTRSASTPPARKVPTEPQGLKEADLVKDMRRSLTRQRKLHDKTRLFKPRIPLPEHRFWIGVMHVGRKANNVSSEKHFTWMKGNRVTTIKTIWHTYQTTTLTDDFVLLLGSERVDYKDTCEELDYFNDKFICLRAVSESEKEAQGKDLSKGCPPEVIEIDED